MKKFNSAELEDGSSITPDVFVKLQKQMLKIQEENEILKNYDHIREKVDDVERTDFIDQQTETYPIQTMCDVLNILRSTYYKSLDKTISKRDQENAEITERIIVIHNDSKQRYGAPKIHHILRTECYHINLKRVQRLINKANIKSITVKKYRPTPSNEKVVERENILERDFSTKSINEKMGPRY